jgi:hypothetical protein
MTKIKSSHLRICLHWCSATISIYFTVSFDPISPSHRFLRISIMYAIERGLRQFLHVHVVQEKPEYKPGHNQPTKTIIIRPALRCYAAEAKNSQIVEEDQFTYVELASFEGLKLHSFRHPLKHDTPRQNAMHDRT